MSAEGNTYYLIKSNVHYTKARGMRVEGSSKVACSDVFGPMTSVHRLMTVCLTNLVPDTNEDKQATVKVSFTPQLNALTPLRYKLTGS